VLARVSLARRMAIVFVGAALIGVFLRVSWGPARFHFASAGRVEAAASTRGVNGPPPVPVAVATASRADLPLRLAALGSVIAFNTVTVRPRVDGQLMPVLFREGRFVNRGDLLAEIDARPFEVQLEQAQGQLARDQAQLANARVDLARYQTLLGEDSIARQNVDAQTSTVAQLGAALKVDQAAIDSARLNLTYSRITAPISGRVGLRLVDAGNVVSASASTGLVVITQVEPIAVVFSLPEDALRTVLPRIRAGATLPVDAFDRAGATRLSSGSVVTVDNQIDQSTGTVRLKAVFHNGDHALFPAQFVNVHLVADTRRQQLVVPAAALQQGPQGPFVYLVRDGKAVVRPVTVGIVESERVSITGGLNAGDVVVTDGADRLREGSALEIVMIENIARYVEAGTPATRGRASGRRADRLHHRVAHRLAHRRADSAAVHERHRRPPLPGICGHAERDDPGVGTRLAHPDADDVRAHAQAGAG
jgi:membrane fusion protein, multidrug efflux system